MRYPLALLVLLAACQSGEPKSPPEPPPAPAPPAPAGEPPPLALALTDDGEAYRDDIARLCDVLALSGADQLDEGSRMYTVASWLGSNLVTDAGHDFLIAMQQENDGKKKGDMLRGEADRLGLPPCKLAESWH